MKSTLAQIGLVASLAYLLVGTARNAAAQTNAATPPTNVVQALVKKDSGIARALYDTKWFTATDSVCHVNSQNSAGDESGTTLDGIGTQRRFDVVMNSGSAGDCLSKFRDDVKKVIEKNGAVVRFFFNSAPSGELRDFSYDYSWHDNVGIIRVRSVATGTNAVAVILFCYEHSRVAPLTSDDDDPPSSP